MGHLSEGRFRYANPIDIRWGANCAETGLGAALDAVGARRVFLVTTASIANNPPIMAAVARAAGGRVVGQAADIRQHAPIEAVAAAAVRARELSADALLSVGGGSPIDAAKAIAFSLAAGMELTAPGALASARGVRLAGRPVLPHFAVPTTLSVAELSGSAGISAAGTQEKVGVAAPELIPTAVFYDAALAVHTPLPLWLSTGIRAVDHAVETLLAEGEHPLPDAAALEALRRLPQALRAARADPSSEQARTDGQLAAWLSYLLPGAAAAGLSHTLGKRIGSPHGIPHGVTSALVLPHVMRFFAARKPGPLVLIGEALGLSHPGPLDAAAALEQLVDELGLPRHAASFGLTEAHLAEAVRPVVGPDRPEAELLAILRAAL